VSAQTIYRVTRLANGARVATATMPHLRGVCVGVWVAAGGRHEKIGECGAAHFVEHLLFKGTRTSSSRDLSFAVEGVGGYLNAYTTEDHTCFYAKAGAAHFRRLIEVLLEMYIESIFPASEVEREREVIREEILSSRDSPSQWVEELLCASLWPSQALGRPLTGTLESLAGLSRRDLRQFHSRHYCGTNTLVTVSGPVDHEEVLDAVREPMRKLTRGKRSSSKKVVKPKRRGIEVEIQPTEQAHVALGFPAYSRTDPRRFALRLLSVILGENMSSRLFQMLREKKGYCYSVQSSTVAFEETGAVQIYADLDPSKLEGALNVIRREFARLRTTPPGRRELQRAKDYAIGQTQISLDSATSQNTWMAESLMAHGRIALLEEVEQAVCAVDAGQIRAVAADCLNLAGSAAAVIGPSHEAAALRRMLCD
jgi:predicted Zn-dependent peptidase